MRAEQVGQIIETEAQKPKIGKVVFYGVCSVCGEKIDVSNKLEFNQKKYYADNFGIEKVGDKWVCKQEIRLQNCPFCEKTPF